MCFGPFKRVCHWGPLIALGIIKVISLMTIHCNSLWWPPYQSVFGFLNSAAFIVCSSLTIYNFLSSIYEGPGYLPDHWLPQVESDKQFLQFCTVCQGYKAPRSHHCKKCGKCVMKMDHHCPWINNCVGHKNQCNFTLFLLFAVSGCSLSTITLTCCTYRALYRTWYLYYGDPQQPLVTMDLSVFVACVFALGLSIGVVLAVGMLLFFQMRAIIRNRTAIEDWILEKAEHRRHIAEEQLKPFVFPYNLGPWENIKQVLTWSLKGDGVTWLIRNHPDCNQYTLTVEQIAQKTEKRQRARAYTVVREYSGRWLPVVYGIRVFCSPPCTEEYRLPLEVGDFVLVTRWKRHWLFGEKSISNTSVKGWFPRCCVVPVVSEKKYE